MTNDLANVSSTIEGKVKDLIRGCNLNKTLLNSILFLNLFFCDAEIEACSRILLNDLPDRVIVGRNMDWNEDMSTNLVYYPRNISRNGDDQKSKEKLPWLNWKSKYASIVATGYEDFTTDGLNEEGLAVHIHWFNDSNYETLDPSKPSLSLTIWTQFYLDNFKTVEEAIAYTKDNPFQVVPFYHELTDQWGKLHLILDDATGDSALLEYVEGELKIHHDRSHVVVTNEPRYEDHLANLLRYQPFGGEEPLPGKQHSMDRFVRANFFVTKLPKLTTLQEQIAGALSILNNVSHPYITGYRTLWHTLSDLTNRIYYFQSTLDQKMIVVRLDQFDFNNDTVMKLDLVNTPEVIGDAHHMFKPVNE